MLEEHCTDGLDSWSCRAWEPFFIKLSVDEYNNNRIDQSRVVCRESLIVPGENGVFAVGDIKKGDIVEWGVAVVIRNANIHDTDKLYTWTSFDRTAKASVATVSGCGLFYNTLGDKSNTRCVPYHKEKRFEVYALEDIKAGTELTFRYDSMNWREGMQEIKGIVGELKE